jgi:hypothetical protein
MAALAAMASVPFTVHPTLASPMLRAGAQIAKDKRFLYHPRPFAHQGVSALTHFAALAPYNGPQLAFEDTVCIPALPSHSRPFPPRSRPPCCPCWDDFQARFTPDQVATLKAATGLDDQGPAPGLLPLAAACSVAPISRFFVGAIACGLSGTWYFGANMEFAGQGLFHSVHAEQSAISNAWLGGETGISEITVNYTPAATAASS